MVPLVRGYNAASRCRVQATTQTLERPHDPYMGRVRCKVAAYPRHECRAEERDVYRGDKRAADAEDHCVATKAKATKRGVAQRMAGSEVR